MTYNAEKVKMAALMAFPYDKRELKPGEEFEAEPRFADALRLTGRAKVVVETAALLVPDTPVSVRPPQPQQQRKAR